MNEKLTNIPDGILLVPVDEELIRSCLLAYCQAHKDNEENPISYLCKEMDIEEKLCRTPFRRSGSTSKTPAEKLFQIVKKRNHLPWLGDLLDQIPKVAVGHIRRLARHGPFPINPTDPDQLDDFISRDGHKRYFHSIAQRYPAPADPENLNPKKILQAISQQPPFRGSLIYFSLRFGWEWEELKNLQLPSDTNIETLKQAWKEEKWELAGKAVYWAYVYQDNLNMYFINERKIAKDKFQSALYQITNCD